MNEPHGYTYQWAQEESRKRLAAIGYQPNELQVVFRHGLWNVRHAESAICDALVEQGSITAWPGDGVGCVAQMIEVQVIRAEKAEAQLVEAEAAHATLIRQLRELEGRGR